jgi:hypothetical protein
MVTYLLTLIRLKSLMLSVNSDRLGLDQTGKIDVSLHRHAHTPPLSLALLSMGSTSIWKDRVLETHRLFVFSLPHPSSPHVTVPLDFGYPPNRVY